MKRSISVLLPTLVICLLSVLYSHFFQTQKNNQFHNWKITISDNKEKGKLEHIGSHYTDSLYAVINYIGISKKTVENLISDKVINFQIGSFSDKRYVVEVIIRHKNKILDTIQLARETPRYLNRMFNFKHPSGYVTIEKCTFNFVNQNETLNYDIRKSLTNLIKFLNESTESKVKSLKFIDSINLNKAKPNRDYYTDEVFVLKQAVNITQIIWSILEETGPSNNYNQYSPLLDRLYSLKNGETIQCTETRDLFIDIFNLWDSKIKIRKVEAFRYYPKIDNVIVNGHSLLELSNGNKWILFDPFVRVYFRDKNSQKILSASDIKNKLKSNKLKEILPIFIPTKHEDRKDFDKKNKIFDKTEYNYFTHFNKIIYW